MRRIRYFWVDDTGVALTEYAVVLAMIAVGLSLALVFLRDSVGGVFDAAADGLGTEPLDPYY